MKKPIINHFKNRIMPIGAAFSLLFSLLPTNLAFAEANQLFVKDSSSQMNLNTIFTITVNSYADSDQTVGSASGTVTYPIDKLRVTGISVSGSGYSSPSITQGSGSIGFNASRNPAPSGLAKIFTITFKAIGAGTAVVGFSSGSKVNGATTTHSSGTYTITNPNPTTPPPKTPKPPSTPKPTPVIISNTPSPTPSVNQEEPEPQPTPDPTGLIDTVTVDPLYDSSSIVWSVHANGATSSLAYGENSSQLDKKAIVTKRKDGTFATTLTGLSPGVRYFFTINASASGGKNGTYSGVVPTRGFPVTITVTENKTPIQSGQIKIGSQSSPIPAGGKVTLGLAAGSYSGTVSTDTASLNINLTVVAKTIPTDGTAPESQSFAYDLTSSPLEQGPGSGFSIFAFIGILFGGTVILGLGFVGFMAYRRRQFEQGGSSGNSYSESPSVIIDDGYDWKAQAEATQEAQDPAPPLTVQPDANPGPNIHHNSVYLSEEEPLDMFEAAEKTSPTLSSHQAPSSSGSTATPQSPSSPHSTTP